MYLLSESVIGNGPAMSKAILSNSAPTLYCFIKSLLRVLGSLLAAHVAHFRHQLSMSSRAFTLYKRSRIFPKVLLTTPKCAPDVPPWISCRTSFTRHLGRTSSIVTAFPSTLSHARFKGRFLL
jgi:hypothetical protein